MIIVRMSETVQQRDACDFGHTRSLPRLGVSLDVPDLCKYNLL
jgi:hypothetical protein